MKVIKIAAVVASMMLCSCSKNLPGQQLTCDDIPGWIDNQPTSSKQFEVVQQCVHKWGYRFALATGSAAEIASAVLYRCRDPLLHYNLLRLRENSPVLDVESDGIDRELRSLAVMRIVQERAGHCSLEPSKK